MSNIVELYNESADELGKHKGVHAINVVNVTRVVLFDDVTIGDKEDGEVDAFMLGILTEGCIAPIRFFYHTKEARQEQYNKLINAWKGN